MSRRGTETRKRTELLAVRLTEAEMHALRAHADRKDMTVPEFVRGLLEAAVPPADDRDET